MSTKSDTPTPTGLNDGLAGLPRTLEWVGDDDGLLRLIDQTKLPLETAYRDCRTAEDVWDAIRVLAVRGAPAIGVAGAYGLCLGTRPQRGASTSEFKEHVEHVAEYLRGCRPTAVNLGWGLDRIGQVAAEHAADGAAASWSAMLAEAHTMAREDIATCRQIGEHGAELIPEGGGVLTHCNAGSLATVAYGTALSVMYVAHEQGRRFRAYADETRPLLQGARITSYELQAAGIDVTVLCDGAAASLMKSGRVQLVVVGADRIAANGDAANKIGTYSVAIAARHHGIPFYVAAPRSTFDLTLPSGDAIPIEERPADEIRAGFGRTTAPAGVHCWNPAFDVTPAELITGIITEVGVVRPVDRGQIERIFASGR